MHSKERHTTKKLQGARLESSRTHTGPFIRKKDALCDTHEDRNKYASLDISQTAPAIENIMGQQAGKKMWQQNQKAGPCFNNSRSTRFIQIGE